MKRNNHNDFSEGYMLQKRKDEDSKRYELEVKKILKEQYGHRFKKIPENIPEYDLETVVGVKIEVKSDYSILESKKLFIEIWDNLSEGKHGWFRYCQADILAVVEVDPKSFTLSRVLFFDFKSLQKYICDTYFKGDWANTYNCYDDYGDRFVFCYGERPYLKFMLVNLKEVQKFIQFVYDYEYPWL